MWFNSLILVLSRWNSVLLMSSVLCVLYWYLHRKTNDIPQNFKVFVGLNSQILNYRSLLLQDDVFLFLCVKFWHRQRYTVDFKMRFCLKDHQLQMNHFFIDFYNIASVRSLLLNGVPSEIKFVHGRIYLEKKLLRAATWNTMEMSYVSDLTVNFCEQSSDDVFVVNGNQRKLSSFIPIFEQDNLNFITSLNIKSTVHKDILFMAPLLQKVETEKEIYCNFEQKTMGLTDFYLMMSSTELQLKRHTLKPSADTTIDVLISQKVIDEGYKVRDLLKLISCIVKELQSKLTESTHPGKPANPLHLPSIELTILSQTPQDVHFHSRDYLVLSTPKCRNKNQFKLTLAQYLCYTYSPLFLVRWERFNAAVATSPKSKFTEAKETHQRKTIFACQFIKSSKTCHEFGILEGFFLSQMIFSGPPSLSPASLPNHSPAKPLSNNIQLFEYLNHCSQSIFQSFLSTELSTQSDLKRYLIYSICLSGDKAVIKMSDEINKELHFCRDCIFNSQKSIRPPEYGDFAFFLFTNTKFPSAREFMCLLHFFCRFMNFQTDHLELFLKVIKNNSRFLDKPKYFLATLGSLNHFIDRFRNIKYFSTLVAAMTPHVSHRNVFSSEKFAIEFWELLNPIEVVGFSPHMKRFLKSKVSFQRYFHLKHKLT